MRRIASLLLLLFVGVPVFAGTSAVTATITDSDSQTWNAGTFQVTFVPQTGTPASAYNVNGASFTQSFSGSMNGSGVLTVSLTDLSTISPTGGQWRFNLCPNASAACSSVVTNAVVGATPNLSTQLSTGLAGPRFSSGPSSYGYLDAEISPTPQPGGTYFNVTTSTTRVWNGTAWLPGGSSQGQFTAASFGAIYDDSTDNCTAFQNLATAAAAYAGPGIPSISFAPPAGSTGKAYKITGCNVIFTIPADIEGYGAVLDCQQSNSFSNCVQLGPTGLSNFANAQTPPYRFQDFTFASGSCVNVTVACIQSPVFVSNPQILRVHSANVGAGNASPPACTNYFISFDGHNNAPQVINNEYWNTDSTTGRCWMINNRTGAGGGTNSGLFEHNTIISAGAATGFTGPCGSVGHSELGSATIVKGNQIYGFDQPIVLINPANSAMIDSNQIDQAGCLPAGVISADIQIGNGSNGAVTGLKVTGNYFPGGAGHASFALSTAQGSTSALSNAVFSNNLTPPANGKSMVNGGGGGMTCSRCVMAANVGFEGTATCSVTGAGGGATCSWNAGTDSFGIMVINTGTTPSASGTITLNYSTGAGGFTGGGASCVMGLHNFTSSWNARATVIVNGGSATTKVWNWDNNAVSLTASQSNAYAVDLVCGKI